MVGGVNRTLRLYVHTGAVLTNAAVHRRFTTTGPGKRRQTQRRLGASLDAVTIISSVKHKLISNWGFDRFGPGRRRMAGISPTRSPEPGTSLELGCLFPDFKTKEHNNSDTRETAVIVRAVLHFSRRTSASSSLWKFIGVCVSGVFPEVISVMRCLFKKNQKNSQSISKKFPCESLSCGAASFLSVVGVQPRHVLLHLPPDHQEHLRYILRELFAEECAAATTEERSAEWIQAPRQRGRFCHKQWAKRHVTAPTGWLTVQLELDKRQILVRRTDTHTCQTSDRLKGCNYRSSASPPIHTGLFSLESRL